MVSAYMQVYQKHFSTRLFIGILGLLVCTHASGQLSSRATVSRAIFSTGIENREPIDQVLILSNKQNVIYFFTDLRFMENQKIIHRWEYEDRVVTSKIFKVGGPRWRVFSKKKLPIDKTGTWRVVVTTEQGLPLRATIFKYVAGDEKENAILPIE